MRRRLLSMNGLDEAEEHKFLDAYDRYADALYRHCTFRVFSKEFARELVQETFMKTWGYLAGGKRIENLRAFLYRTAHNLIIDASRRKREQSLEAMREGGGDEGQPFEPGDAGAQARDIERRADMHSVFATLKTLPEEFRTMLTMRYVDDLEPREIADILGISANAASVRIHRALETLKKYLEAKP